MNEIDVHLARTLFHEDPLAIVVYAKDAIPAIEERDKEIERLKDVLCDLCLLTSDKVILDKIGAALEAPNMNNYDAAMHRIEDLLEEIRLLKACIFSCLQSDDYYYIKQRMEIEESRWDKTNEHV